MYGEIYERDGKSNYLSISLCHFVFEILVQLTCVLALRFYYYTAGSGGAGPTILSTSFLLLGEEVVAYNKGWVIDVAVSVLFVP